MTSITRVSRAAFLAQQNVWSALFHLNQADKYGIREEAIRARNMLREAARELDEALAQEPEK